MDCGGKMVQSVGYKAQVTNTNLTNRRAWPWTSKVSKEVSQKKRNPIKKETRDDMMGLEIGFSQRTTSTGKTSIIN
jgi:hypothetical protein